MGADTEFLKSNSILRIEVQTGEQVSKIVNNETLEIEQMSELFFLGAEVMGGGRFSLDLEPDPLGYFQSGFFQSL